MNQMNGSVSLSGSARFFSLYSILVYLILGIQYFYA